MRAEYTSCTLVPFKLIGLNSSLNLSRNRYVKLNFGPSRVDHFGYRSSFLADPHRDFGFEEEGRHGNFPESPRFDLLEPDDFGGFEHPPQSARFDPKSGSFDETLTRGVAMAKAAGMVPENVR